MVSASITFIHLICLPTSISREGLDLEVSVTYNRKKIFETHFWKRFNNVHWIHAMTNVTKKIRFHPKTSLAKTKYLNQTLIKKKTSIILKAWTLPSGAFKSGIMGNSILKSDIKQCDNIRHNVDQWTLNHALCRQIHLNHAVHQALCLNQSLCQAACLT